MSARWTTLLHRVLLCAVAIAIVLAVRVVQGSRAELRRGEELEAAGQLELAIVHFRRAARWYAPGNGSVDAALTALARIGSNAERAKDVELALSAWRGVRASILSTRSVFTPHPERLREANRHIARLMATHNVPPMDQGKSEPALEAEHLALLEGNHRPNVAWTLLALLGFVAWVGGVYRFIDRAIGPEDELVTAAAWRWGTVVLVGLALFVLGLAFA
ncbi:MAG: hypothetical protein R3A78_13020 [Polyangiales bacterium]